MAVESFCLVCHGRDKLREQQRELHKHSMAGWHVELVTVDEAKRRQAEQR